MTTDLADILWLVVSKRDRVAIYGHGVIAGCLRHLAGGSGGRLLQGEGQDPGEVADQDHFAAAALLAFFRDLKSAAMLSRSAAGRSSFARFSSLYQPMFSRVLSTASAK